MNKAERLKEPGVTSLDPHGENRSAHLAGHAYHLRRPDRVVDATRLQAETGNLAGRERHNTATRTQMREDTTRACDITRIGRIRTEGIDLDQPWTDTRNLTEPTITDDQRIRPGAEEEIHRHQSVGQTMRMIRNHDERPRTRDAREALIAPSVVGHHRSRGLHLR